MNDYMLMGCIWMACGASLLISADMIKHPEKATCLYGIAVMFLGIFDIILGVIK